MKPAFIVGACKGFELGHDTFACVLMIYGKIGLAFGVFLMGLGWIACRRVWERAPNGKGER